MSTIGKGLPIQSFYHFFPKINLPLFFCENSLFFTRVEFGILSFFKQQEHQYWYQHNINLSEKRKSVRSPIKAFCKKNADQIQISNHPEKQTRSERLSKRNWNILWTNMSLWKTASCYFVQIGFASLCVKVFLVEWKYLSGSKVDLAAASSWWLNTIKVWLHWLNFTQFISIQFNVASHVMNLHTM